MDSADLFRHILTTKTLPEETKLGYEFRFKTVFYNDGASYCCCRCAYDHEYFSYISESGDIDWEKCDTLVQAIKDGRCQHAARATKKEHLSETVVNVFHISAALGSETLLPKLLSKVEEEIELESGSIKSELFRVFPHRLAAMRGNVKVVQMLFKDGTPSKHLNEDFFNTCTRNILYAVEKEHNIIQLTISSVLEVCIIKGHIAIVKMLLCDLYRKYTCPGEWTRIYEYLFKNNLTEMLDPILSDEKIFPTPPCHCACSSLKARCLGCKKYDNRLMKFWEIAELAVIYNVRDIFFNKSIQRLYDALLCSEKYRHYRKPLFESCRAFQRQDFLELLSANECQNLYTESISETQIFVNLFMLLKKYTLSGHHIGSVMKQIPDIQRIVNAPFGAIVGSGCYGYWDLCPGLTPLQSYICRYERHYDVSVVRTLIDCGADIDQMFPPNFKDDERCVYPRGNTVLMHILNEDIEFNKVFREMLELLLYENVAVALNDSAVSLCLKRYHYQIEPSDWESDSDIITIEERTDSRKHKGIYVMDSCVRATPFFYTVPLLIEAGFKYSLADVETVLFPENELVKVKYELNQLRDESRRPYHIERMPPSCHVSEYLEQCLRTPRALKLRCRDVLRSHYPRRQIHKYVSCEEIPEKIKDFLLLKPILQTLSVDREY